MACLPKLVLWNILDTVDVSNELDQPFDLLKEGLLGQFGKSKWQSYFELLRFPMECRATSPAFSWENSNNTYPMALAQTTTFLSKFLIRPPPSMREEVGAGNHKTALTIFRAVDALWVIFYRRFLPNCAWVLRTLTDLLRGGA